MHGLMQRLGRPILEKKNVPPRGAPYHEVAHGQIQHWKLMPILHSIVLLQIIGRSIIRELVPRIVQVASA
jgi:hypothetical protein